MSAPRVLVMPGASLMQIMPVAGGLRVHCPGCNAEQVFAAATAETTAAFVHADGCPVHRRIEDALSRYAHSPVQRG